MERFSSHTTSEFSNILKNLSYNYKKNIKIKNLNEKILSKGGRSSGTIIAPRRGDFHKRLYRYIDFNRLLLPKQSAIILRTIYDPNRTAALSLICYPIGILSYILKPAKLNVGELIHNLTTTSIYYGDATLLRHFPSGSLIYNINGKFTRSAGCSTILVRKDADQALLKLKSGELRYFNNYIFASSGAVSNENHFLRIYRKAGTMRHLGFRPRTRPSSMNPVDHPMGGRTRGGTFPKNAKGLITLNRPTVKKHHPTILYTKRQLKLLKQ